MRRPWAAPVFFVSIALLHAAHKPVPGEGRNAKVEIHATLVDPAELNRTFHHDFNGNYTVVEVRLTPLAGSVRLKLDDFLLRSDRDGDKSTPFVASQIAGAGGIVVTRTMQGGGAGRGSNGPGWSMPGTMGRPRQLPGDGSNAGNMAGVEGRSSRAANEKGDADLKKDLTARILPEGEVTAPATGLLFFAMEDKQKPKDLELVYSGDPADKVRVRFK